MERKPSCWESINVTILKSSGDQAPADDEMKKQIHISMKIILKAERIKKLKSMIVEDQESGVKNPTRLEVVAAFLIRYNLLASSLKPIVLFIGMNLRPQINPPLEGTWRTFEEIAKRGVEYYTVTTSCNMPYYDIDFKWGKPERVTVASLPSKNYFFLLDDSNGGGVEAIASIDEQVLPILEKNEEFLSFASLDPLSS
ncbi:hypothetical protein LIER_10834 [Lithospermum erythrorhizon]|uniref:Uncharacterized protein n=1 Tax=Lithospermum erythrorhizon TaxID=34254 RepID=A0AAV3PMI1_LITER